MDRETVEEIKRHFGVVAEDLRSDVRAVAEGQDLLRECFEAFEKRVDGQFQRVDDQFQRVTGEFQRVAGEFQRVTGEFQRVAGEFQRVWAEFSEVKSMIRLSYAEIDRRFGVLETEVADLRTRVERIEARG